MEVNDAYRVPLDDVWQSHCNEFFSSSSSVILSFRGRLCVGGLFECTMCRMRAQCQQKIYLCSCDGVWPSVLLPHFPFFSMKFIFCFIYGEWA